MRRNATTRRTTEKIATVFFWALCALLLWQLPVQAARIKDIVDIKGARQNQLVGYGLVVGLSGTGDGKNAVFTSQSLAAVLDKMGVTVNPEQLKGNNVAAVMVTAALPAFAKTGSRIDVMVSSIGGAESLQGGTLLLTPLRAANSQVYAVAQGAVSTGGFVVRGASAGVAKNFPTVGRVADGALIERELAVAFNEKERLSLALRAPDFTTAARVAAAINATVFNGAASTPDGGTVDVIVPQEYLGNVVAFVSLIENLEVTPDLESKVVINERTGTIIMGESVRISTVAIAHGNLSIQINESANVSQPLPFSEGQTVVIPQTDVAVQEGRNPIILVNQGVSIGDVVRALNALGVSPRDLIAIFQALKAAGALQAKLEII
ncbi:MAG: flagellar basal body P-ring protein FlgI [Deltaproteobacteria bacterium]|nr:flagellar basal body P-ring protein FlgI [Deltaproteobacteria bacterium]